MKRNSWLWILGGLVLGFFFLSRRKPVAGAPDNGYGAPLNALAGSALRYLTPRTNPEGARPLVGGGGKVSANGGQPATGSSVDLGGVFSIVKSLFTSSPTKKDSAGNEQLRSSGTYVAGPKLNAQVAKFDNAAAAQTALPTTFTHNFSLDDGADFGAPEVFDGNGSFYNGDGGIDYGTDVA